MSVLKVHRVLKDTRELKVRLVILVLKVMLEPKEILALKGR
jgi:hypothetical protein